MSLYASSPLWQNVRILRPSGHRLYHIVLLILAVLLIAFQVKRYWEVIVPAKVLLIHQTKVVYKQQRIIVTPPISVDKKINYLEHVFGIGENEAKAFVTAGIQTGIDPLLLATLSYTESNFRKWAVSPVGYKGLMQTPKDFEYSSMDILYGAEILKSKLEKAKGNLYIALAMYKGGLNQTAFSEAQQVLELYNKVLHGEVVKNSFT